MKNGHYELIKAPPDYPGKRYRGKYCYEHILVWWQNTGVLPKADETVHHKDENKRHNVFSNLELLTRKKHAEHHGEERKKTMVILKCVGCKKEFKKEKRNTHLVKPNKYSCCSRPCIGVATGLMRSEPKEFNRRVKENVVRIIKE